jgi:hypothetical protein
MTTTTSWSDEKKLFLLNQLIDMKTIKGNMTDTGNFKTATWTQITKAFNDEFKVNWDYQVLKMEYSNTKTKFQAYESLMNLSGQPFYFDEDTQMVLGDASQWDSVISTASKSKAPFFKQLRAKPYLNLDKIQTLLEGTLSIDQGEIATGTNAITVADVIPVKRKAVFASIVGDCTDSVPETPCSKQEKSSASSTPSSTKSNSRKGSASILGESIKSMGMTLASVFEQKEQTRYSIVISVLSRAVRLLNETGPHGLKLLKYIAALKKETNGEIFVALGETTEADGQLSRMVWLESIIE